MGVWFRMFSWIDMLNRHPRQSQFLLLLQLCFLLFAEVTSQFADELGNSEFSGSFGEFMSNTFIDGEFGETFLPQFITSKYVFEQSELADTTGGLYKRSIREDCEGKCSKKGIIPLKHRNDTSINWQPLQGYPTTPRIFLKQRGPPLPLRSGNHTYNIKYGPAPKPLGYQIQIVKPEPVYKKENEGNETDALQERNYETQAYKLPKAAYPSGYRENITTYERKKLPRFLLPFPFGLYTKDPVRPFPKGSIFTIMPAIIVPFIPFGIWELRLPVAWSLNYLVERFNGIDEGSLTPGRGYGSKEYISQGRKFANQQMDMYDWAGDLLSNTLGMDGKACVQRLICELAEVPVNDRSFMGEILHRIIDPRRDGRDDETNDYTLAEDQGRYFGGCFEKYGKCPLTIRRLLPDNYIEMMKRRRRR